MRCVLGVRLLAQARQMAAQIQETEYAKFTKSWKSEQRYGAVDSKTVLETVSREIRDDMDKV